MSVTVVQNPSPFPNESSRHDTHASILKAMNNSRNETHQRINSRTMVDELVLGRPVKRIELLVLRRFPRRTVKGKSWTGPLAAACARDESGLVGLILWGEQVDSVRTGDIIRIENGWCRLSMGQKVVSTGRTGIMTVLEP